MIQFHGLNKIYLEREDTTKKNNLRLLLNKYIFFLIIQ